MKVPNSKKSRIRKFKHGLTRGIRGVLALNDSPHRIAWGVAIGTFVAYLPIVGIQMIVGAVICYCMRANVLASIPMAWITNPVTIVPIYFLLYLLGGVFTGDSMTYTDMEALVGQINEAGIFTKEGFNRTTDLILSIFWPMLIGGVIVGVINGVLFYFLTLKLVAKFQLRRLQKRLLWQQQIEQSTATDVNPEQITPASNDDQTSD